jgi:hypothetical protein
MDKAFMKEHYLLAHVGTEAESNKKRINFTTEECLPVLISVFEMNFSSTNPTRK